jgi:hypothetical protein
MVWSEFPTFKAGEALLPKRRVKVESGTTTDPVEVVYADAGEQHIGTTGNESTADGALVSVQPMNATGTYEGTAADSFARGAVLYGAADGKISDTSSGSAIGVALEAATAAGDIVEWISFAVLSTTAATVSYADASGFTTAATVEDALDELYQNALSAQQCIPLPLANFKETTNFDVGNIAANGGVLASDSTPILEAINAATDGCQRFNWAATNVDQVTVQAILPPDIDVTADIVFHCRIASEGTTDAVGFTVDWFINEGDTKVVDTTTTNQTATYAEKIATLGNADIDAGAQTITIGLTPVAHGTDAMYMTAAWLEYTSVLKTS